MQTQNKNSNQSGKSIDPNAIFRRQIPKELPQPDESQNEDPNRYDNEYENNLQNSMQSMQQPKTPDTIHDQTAESINQNADDQNEALEEYEKMTRDPQNPELKKMETAKSLKNKEMTYIRGKIFINQIWFLVLVVIGLFLLLLELLGLIGIGQSTLAKAGLTFKKIMSDIRLLRVKGEDMRQIQKRIKEIKEKTKKQQARFNMMRRLRG